MSSTGAEPQATARTYVALAVANMRSSEVRENFRRSAASRLGWATRWEAQRKARKKSRPIFWRVHLQLIMNEFFRTDGRISSRSTHMRFCTSSRARVRVESVENCAMLARESSRGNSDPDRVTRCWKAPCSSEMVRRMMNFAGGAALLESGAPFSPMGDGCPSTPAPPEPGLPWPR